jgi:hypothetical protein
MKALSGSFGCRLLTLLVSCVMLLILLHMLLFVLPKLPTPLPPVEHEQLCDQLDFDSRQILLVGSLYEETRSLRAGLTALLHPLLILTSLLTLLQILSFWIPKIERSP